MSLLKTLAKVAIGVAVAKGVGGMMQKRGGQTDAPSPKAGNGGLFGGANSPQPQAGGGGLEDMMSDILGGGKAKNAGIGGSAGGSGTLGGLGGLLEGLGAPQSGGLNDLLEGTDETAEARAPAGGGIGDLLGGLLGAGAAGKATGGFGDLLNQALAGQSEPEVAPSPNQEAMAGLMLRAMIQAAKSDGKIDDAERAKLLDRLGDVSPEERMFVQSEMAAPVDVNGLARQVPRGLEQQIYAMSVMGIDLDQQAEAQYLHDLARALSLQPQMVNAIHQQMGVPTIYS